MSSGIEGDDFMNQSIMPMAKTSFNWTPRSQTGRGYSYGRPYTSGAKLHFGNEQLVKNNRPRIIPDLEPEEPKPMRRMRWALNWLRHAGSLLSMFSSRYAKTKSSERLVHQARIALGDGQLHTALLKLQESVDVLPECKNLYKGYKELGQFLMLLSEDQKFLATASTEDKQCRQARAMSVRERPNKDGTKPFRTLDYWRALENTSLNIEELAKQAFETSIKLLESTGDQASGEYQFRLAGLLEGCGKKRRALAAYRQAAKLDDQYTNALTKARERLGRFPLG